MARHRSPRGRRARIAAADVPTPVRRGAAVVAVTGGALSVVAAGVPELVAAGPAVPEVAAAAVLPVGATAAAAPAQAADLGALIAPSVQPVAPDPEVADATDLVKAVQLAEAEVARIEAERAAAEQRAAAERAAAERAAAERAAAIANCGLATGSLGAVKPWVRDAAHFLGCRFGEPTVLGVAGRGGPSDHPVGLAVDFMVNRATGDALAACALENMDALGVKYVIWRQRINHGNGWSTMEDRGSVTANHYDHVHISFDRSAGSGDPTAC